ncbi:MAG: hypothetical protein ACXITV_01065 [Luteibaculaceae bacterium]
MVKEKYAIFGIVRGYKQYELSNHLGNVLTTISDKKGYNLQSDYYLAEILSAQDYYPGGMLQPGRVYSNSDYRYGFNGFEKDDEIKGSGNHLSFGDYGYDSRLLRRWNVDPLTFKFPNQSPFSAFNGNPIYYIDPDGKSGVAYKTKNINEATKRPILKVVSNVYIYGDGAIMGRAEHVQSELNSQYNRNGNYFTHTDETGTEYDVVFEFNVSTIDESTVKEKIGELNPEDNFFEIDSGDNSFTLTGVGGNTGMISISDLEKNQFTFSHEYNHGLGGLGHPKGPISKDATIDISLPQDQKYTDGSTIDAKKRHVTQNNIDAIFKNVKFNDEGVGNVGEPRPQKAKRGGQNFEDVRD